MKKHRKLFYIPGMITLLVFPILCYFNLMKLKRQNKEERVLEIILACKPFPKNNLTIHFDTTILSEPAIRRLYLDIRLNGNETEDKIKLAFFRLYVKEMKETNDIKKGIHIMFVDSVKYGTYLETFNIILKEKIARYIYYENNLWVLNLDGDKAKMEARIKRKQEKEAQEKLEAKNSEIIKTPAKTDFSPFLKVWPVFLVFFIIAFLSIRKVVRLKRGVSGKL